MKKTVNSAKALTHILLTAIYFVAVFAFFRLLFVLINFDRASQTPLTDIALSFAYGLQFDLSIIGYISIVSCLLYAILGPFGAWKAARTATDCLSAVILIFTALCLPADAIVYSFWGIRFDASALDFLKTPELIVASVEVWQTVAYAITTIALAVGLTWLIFRISARIRFEKCRNKTLAKTVQSLGFVIIGAAMIIPVRGGTGIAPLNTGRAFFCENIFANHTALNPLWNFAYSLKRLDTSKIAYRFMDDAKAESIFDSLMAESGDYPRVLNTERPNIIVVMLESFSAHGIEFLGGENATPTIKSLLPQSISFDNMMAASDRSGKGMVALHCGHPVMPTFSIIQFPQKTQSLPFVAKELRRNGYDDQLFIYAGDLNFNNFNSLVTMAGYNTVITQDDFDNEQLGDKWGAHDQYAFDRLFESIEKQKQPFFDFFFTLSSHEPFTVPMPKQLEDPYLNSMFYTDKCLGEFIAKASQRPWWSNTLLILIADHGHPGPPKVGNDSKMRFKIPMIWTGGAVAVRDTVISKPATQTDLANTLLTQLGIDAKAFRFSKNLFDRGNEGFSFYDFNDGFGFVHGDHFQVYDNTTSKFIKFEGEATPLDSVAGKAILQMISNDNKKR